MHCMNSLRHVQGDKHKLTKLYLQSTTEVGSQVCKFSVMWSVLVIMVTVFDTFKHLGAVTITQRRAVRDSYVAPFCCSLPAVTRVPRTGRWYEPWQSKSHVDRDLGWVGYELLALHQERPRIGCCCQSLPQDPFEYLKSVVQWTVLNFHV